MYDLRECGRLMPFNRMDTLVGDPNVEGAGGWVGRGVGGSRILMVWFPFRGIYWFLGRGGGSSGSSGRVRCLMLVVFSLSLAGGVGVWDAF